MNTLQLLLATFQITLFIAFLYYAVKAMVMIITEYDHNKNMHK